MNWDSSFENFKNYLKLERGLSDNSIKSYDFDLNLFKKFLVSVFEEKHKLNLLNIFFEKFLKRYHLIKDFFVILPLIKNIGIFFSCKFKIIFGQSSESIKNAAAGFQ